MSEPMECRFCGRTIRLVVVDGIWRPVESGADYLCLDGGGEEGVDNRGVMVRGTFRQRKIPGEEMTTARKMHPCRPGTDVLPEKAMGF